MDILERHLSRCACAALVLGIGLTPLPAGADDAVRPALPAASDRDPGTRLRLGIGGELGLFGGGPVPHLATTPERKIVPLIISGGVLGAYVRAGAQLGDRLGVHVTVAGAGGLGIPVLVSYHVRVAALVDWSLARHFSIGTGVSFTHTDAVFNVDGDPVTGNFIGIPVALAFFTGGRHPRTGARHGTGIFVTPTIGYADIAGEHGRYRGFGGGITLSVGYELR